MRGRVPLTSEDQEEEEPHPDPEKDLHDDLPQGRAQEQADQGGATLIVLHQHIFRCVGIALNSCNCVYNCPLMFSFHTQTIQ